MRRRVALRLEVLWWMAFVPACTAPTFRPSSPRRVEDDGLAVEIQRADLRHFVVDLGVSGASPAEVEGAWVSHGLASEGAPCARPLAAHAIEKAAPSNTGATFKLHFAPTLFDVLERPSVLELRVAVEGGHPRCLALPFSGADPSLRWTLEPWGNNRPFVGRGIGVWFPVGSHHYSAESEVLMFRLGRWWGPVRLGASAGGFGFACCTRGDRNAAFVIPTALTAESFPAVAGHFALGVGASYALRPSWFVNDNSRGFELVHGPVGSIEIAYLPNLLVGFLEGPRAGTVSLAFSLGRWLPDGGATVLGVSMSVN